MTDWEEMDLKIRIMELKIRIMGLHQVNTNNAYRDGLITNVKYRDYLIEEQSILNDLMKKLSISV